MSKNLLEEQFDNNQKNKETPKDMFSRSNLDLDNEETKTRKKTTQNNKTSTLRISLTNINRLKALSEVLQLSSIDEAIGNAMDNRELSLNDTEKTEYKMMLKILNRKNNL